jgi:integrase
MSAVPLPGARGSKLFDPSFNVLSGHQALAGVDEQERIAFADDVWDFAKLRQAPRYPQPSSLRVQFRHIESDRHRRLIRELLAAKLNPQLPAVAAIPDRRPRPLDFASVYQQSTYYRRFLSWLDERGVHHLADVDQEICDGYLAVLQASGITTKSVAAFISRLREFAIYGEVLSESFPTGFRPWKRVAAERIASVPTHRENKTHVIPCEVLDPLVAAALITVQRFSGDVLAARDEVQRLKRVRLTTARDLSVTRLAALLEKHKAAGRPLPLRRHVGNSGDPVGLVNLTAVARAAGVKLERPLDPHLHGMLAQAAELVGVAPGALWLDLAMVDRGDGSAPQPWLDAIDDFAVQHLLGKVMTACFIVIAALSGMRWSEVAELRPGCGKTVEQAGFTRSRIGSVVVKGRPAGGVPESWLVVDVVLEAVQVLEAMHAGSDAEYLFAGSTVEVNEGAKNHQRVEMITRLQRFVGWHNAMVERTGLDRIPDVNGQAFHLTPSQFRRTLAVLLGSRRLGAIATKVQLKHVYIAVSEGYMAPRGESRRAFQQEIETAEEEARLRRAETLYAEHRNGAVLAGGGGRKLATRLDQALVDSEPFGGAVDRSGRRPREALRKLAGVLHPGVLNDCFFTDARAAKCLRGQSEHATAPNMPGCQPAKCANAIVALDHVPRWRTSIETSRSLLDDPLVPDGERLRLEAAIADQERVIAPFDDQEGTS